MKQNNSYEIQFSGLRQGLHDFQWKIDKLLFEAFNNNHFDDVKLNCSLNLEKKERLMNLYFTIEGQIKTICDRCGEQLVLPLSLENKLIVRFAEENDFTDDEVVFLANNEHRLELGQFIYEFVMTGLPLRLVHDDGECDPSVDEFLEEEIKEETETNETMTDPRWEELKKIKNND
ncbi:MAG: DUF177 domain-containing protein [Salibacteraceae bacterium]